MEEAQGSACLASVAPFLITMLMWAPAVQADFQLGSRVSIPVPPAYEPGFEARAFVLQTPAGILPPVKLALSIFAREGNYICGAEVIQDGFIMWSTGCPSRFEPVEACVISLSVDGDFALMDSKNNVGWSSNTSRHGVKYIQLKRSGNLVLRNRFHVMVWQSFDYPCEKLLWAQKLSKQSRLLSPGAAQHTLSLQGNELVLEWRGLRYWAATANAEIDYAQVGARGIELWANGTLNTVVGPKGNNDDAGYADLGLPVHFAALGQAGGLILYAYGPPWTSVYSAPEQPCDYPESCGPYGLCTANANGVNGKVVSSDDVSCSCLPYFRPSSAARGCGLPAGYAPTFCGQPAEFLELWGLDTALEAPPSGRRKLSRADCAATCMGDCTCLAATSVNESECQLYSELGSVRRKGSLETGLTLWVKVPKGLTSSGGESCEMKRIHKLILILGASVDSVAVVLLGIGILYYFFVYRPRKIRESSQQSQTA